MVYVDGYVYYRDISTIQRDIEKSWNSTFNMGMYWAKVGLNRLSVCLSVLNSCVHNIALIVGTVTTSVAEQIKQSDLAAMKSVAPSRNGDSFASFPTPK